MRAVPDRKLLESCVHQRGQLARAREWNWIETAVDHERRGKRNARCELAQPRPEIVVAQASPDLVLRPRHDAKRRQVLGVVEIAEIAGNRQLEGAPLIRFGIALTQSTRAEGVALTFDLRRLHAPGELLVELPPVLGRDRRGRDEREPLDAIGMLEDVEHGEQSTPRIATQCQALEAEVEADRIEVGDVLSPTYCHVPRYR